MVNRRRFLTAMGGAVTVSTAGCYGGEEIWLENSTRDDGSDEGGDNNTSTEDGDDPSSDQSDTDTTRNEEPPLPGNPVSIRDGRVPLQNISTVLETSSTGFNSVNAEADFGRSAVSVNEEAQRVNMEVASDHRGTGQASGFASGSFQAAWQAPADGEYRITASYHRGGDFLYDYPNSGDISASFDTTVLAIRYNDSNVLSKESRPELQHRNGQLQLEGELAEYIIATGAAAAAGSALGLGLIGRLFLKQVVKQLVELEGFNDSGSQIYDVYQTVERHPENPWSLSTTFRAAEGDVLIFELSSTLSMGFEIRDSWWFQPSFLAHCEFASFEITPQYSG